MPSNNRLSMREWRTRVSTEYQAGNLTPLYRDVANALADSRGRLGIFPSHYTLSIMARCSVKTVQRALAHMVSLNLVTWEERFSPRGDRRQPRRRLTNVYFLVIPDEPVTPGNGPVWTRRPPIGHCACGNKKVSKTEAYEEASVDSWEAREANARIAAEREKTLAVEWQAKRQENAAKRAELVKKWGLPPAKPLPTTGFAAR